MCQVDVVSVPQGSITDRAQRRFRNRRQFANLVGALLIVLAVGSLARAASTLYVSGGLGVTAYDESGAPLAGFTPISPNANLVAVQGIAVGSDNVLYVAGQDSNNILRYNATTGAFIDQLASLGGGRYPEGLALGPDYNGDSISDLYVAEWGTNDVAVVPTAGTGAGVAVLFAGTDMQQPINIEWRPDGKLYVASRQTNQIQKFNSNGTFDATFADATRPGGFAFSPDGSKFYTGDTFSNSGTTIEQYDSSGVLVGPFTTGLAGGPKGMAFGPDGNLYVADTLGAGVTKIDGATGAILNPAFIDLQGNRARFLLWHNDSTSQPVVGDYNGNGLVDGADYVVWRDSLGQTGAGLPADGDSDGSVDNDDYGVWRGHFGNGSGSGSSLGGNSAVPEPNSLVILLITGAAIISRRRTRQLGNRI
jgi:sugar lactone lactonase YvrE